MFHTYQANVKTCHSGKASSCHMLHLILFVWICLNQERSDSCLQNNHLSIEEFHAKLQEATNFPLRPFVIPFLKVSAKKSEVISPYMNMQY